MPKIQRRVVLQTCIPGILSARPENHRAIMLKRGQVMDLSHVARLRRARELLAAKNFDIERTVLACYSSAGFTDRLRAAAKTENQPRLQLIDLTRLYSG